MDLCLLCLENNKDSLEFIDSSSSQWQYLNITTIVEKYFWPLDEVQNNSWICSSCWQHLEEFHNFHRRVEEAHLNFDKIKLEVSDIELRDSVEDIKTKEENEEELSYEKLEIDNHSNIVLDVKNENILCLEKAIETLNCVENNQNTLLTTDPLEKIQCVKSKKRKHKKETKTKNQIGIINKQNKEDIIPTKTEIKDITNKESESLDFTDNDSEYSSNDEDKSITENSKFEEIKTWQEKDFFIGQHFKNILCDVCQNPLENFSVLQKHFKTIHKRRGYIICCKRKLYSHGVVIDHIRWHEDPEYFKCLECGKVMLDRRNLNIHKQTMHLQNETTNINSDNNDSEYSTNDEVTPNTSKTNKNTLDNSKFDEFSTWQEKDDFIGLHFKNILCDICQLPLENFSVVKKHFQTAHNRGGYIICCNRRLSAHSIVIDHIRWHMNPEYFKCLECGKAMLDRRNLKIHKQNVHRHKRTVVVRPCKICGKSFDKIDLLRKHKLTHTEEDENAEGKYPCQQCGKFYRQAHLLKRHNDVVHLKKHARICDICGKSCSTTTDYKMHRRIHDTNPAIIKCDVCGIRLVSERNLKIHKKHQHPEGGLQEHPCPQCDKVAHTAVALRRHIYYMHENGVNCKCTVCGKTFKKSKILKEHMALHTGDTLYKCPWCPKTFNSSANLGVHRRKYHLKEWEEDKLKRQSC